MAARSASGDQPGRGQRCEDQPGEHSGGDSASAPKEGRVGRSTGGPKEAQLKVFPASATMYHSWRKLEKCRLNTPWLGQPGAKFYKYRSHVQPAFGQIWDDAARSWPALDLNMDHNGVRSGANLADFGQHPPSPILT